jgi:hypothetical protein
MLAVVTLTVVCGRDTRKDALAGARATRIDREYVCLGAGEAAADLG